MVSASPSMWSIRSIAIASLRPMLCPSFEFGHQGCSSWGLPGSTRWRWHSCKFSYSTCAFPNKVTRSDICHLHFGRLRIQHIQRVEGGWWAWTLVHQGQFHDFAWFHISQVLQVCCDAVALHTYYTVTQYISSICNIHIQWLYEIIWTYMNHNQKHQSASFWTTPSA